MKELILGIDIGTSACKLAVFHREKGLVTAVTETYPTYYPENGWAEQDPEDWWNAVLRGLTRLFDAGIRAEEIAVIGVDGQSWGPVFLDEKGEVLTRTPIWQDTRSKIYLDEYTEEEKREFFEVCGNPLQPGYATLKIRWIREHEPEAFSRLRLLLLSSSFLVYRLTGVPVQDLSQAYAWHFFDMHTGSYRYDLAERFGIGAGMLPPVHDCQDIVGTIGKRVAGLTGLAEGTPVIAGALDAASANLGAGIIHDGECQEQGGQAGGMSICTSEYRASPDLILSFHVIPGKWLLQGGTIGGGGVLKWIAREMGDYERYTLQEGDSVYDRLTALAGEVPAGSNGLVFLPYMSGERSPIWNPNAKGVYYGLDYSKTKGHMIRAAMEGVAYSVRHNLDAAEKVGCFADSIRATGGSANSALWTQMKADILEKEVTVCNSDTTTVLGTAILAGVGAGLYTSYDQACEQLIHVEKRYTPNPAVRETYREGYEIYLELYKSLRHLMT